jgi:hypothetical protein
VDAGVISIGDAVKDIIRDLEHNVGDLMGYIMRDGPWGLTDEPRCRRPRPRSCGGPSSATIENRSPRWPSRRHRKVVFSSRATDFGSAGNGSGGCRVRCLRPARFWLQTDGPVRPFLHGQDPERKWSLLTEQLHKAGPSPFQSAHVSRYDALS